MPKPLIDRYRTVRSIDLNMRFGYIFFGLFLLASPSSAQLWGSVEGKVTSGETALEGVSIVVSGTNFGTATNRDGTYVLRMPDGRYALRFSAVGYEARVDSVTIRFGATARLDASLRRSTVQMEEVTIERPRDAQDAGVFELAPRAARDIPTPVRDIARALKVLPGVATNNELSNQVSVRGGGFNENLFFIDGFEIFLPFRPRQGEQEGLSLLNADLAERLTFYAGGFPARDGGKLSSAVEVAYRDPGEGDWPPSGSIYLSLLDAGASLGGRSGRLGWLFGARRAMTRRFFATQELKGDYDPAFTDAQLKLEWDGPGQLSIEGLGIWAHHEFRLNPNARKTFFGTVSQNEQLAPSNLQSVFIQYDPGNEERDGYETGFGGLRISTPIGLLRTSHDVALFSTVETERFDLSGMAVLFLVDPGSGGEPQPGAGLFPIGRSRQEDAADNRVSVRTLTGQGRYTLPLRMHAFEAGWQLRRLNFEDRLNEKSVVSGRATTGEAVRIVADSLTDDSALSATRASLYIQDSWSVLPESPDRFTVTAGVRGDYFDFNEEWTWSPRMTARYRVSERTLLLASWGIYYQSPSYRELRGRPEPGETILGSLNDGLRSQRSHQIVVGTEYFLPRLQFFLRAEAYAKQISNVISYDIDNVRVRYSGENDADATVRGVDVQLRGEFVPGMESWVNYSFLYARERFDPAFLTQYNLGSVARPTDQRHTMSLYLQDYIPNDPSWKLHLRTLFGSGLPYTPPVPGPRIGQLVAQAPGPRFADRYPRYFRFDMGVTKELVASERGLGRPVDLSLTFEILNLFNMTNTVAYSWIPNNSGIWTRVPTRLTPRTVNVRLRLDF